ncbi:MAG TPA: hypothetical protein DET40_14910 [Lentisphaeria bacterium]|nr:MAG: hypothetical protein A2X45_06185 [Lentisphaerae bacterium GWF2_50_93]HCE44828.1 hypothetical protein [Lentisphaeria bacterium]
MLRGRAMSVIQNHYDVLGVGFSAGFRDMKKAYYRQVKLCHPDLYGGSRAKEEEFKLLVMAFDVLSDPDKRRKYDYANGIGIESHGPVDWTALDEFSIMDTPADDTLEEIIVGNDPPEDTTLATLFLDLERTDVFMAFREGKNYFRNGQCQGAFQCFKRNVEHSPNNILYRYYLAKTLLAFNNFSEARTHFNIGVNIGKRRIPPQKLKRFHDELDAMAIKQNPRWKKLVDFFGGAKSLPEYVDSEEMTIRETNRAIAHIMSSERRKNLGNDRKLLK